MTFEILCETCNTLADLLTAQRGLYHSMAMSERAYFVLIVIVIIAVIVVTIGSLKKKL